MRYTMLLWPHANARYRAETLKLACAETQLLLARFSADSVCAPTDIMGMPALFIDAPVSFTDVELKRLGEVSWCYGVFADGADGSFIPAAGRSPAYLGEDLPGILKYKGKTNEMFTQMLVNTALWSTSVEDDGKPFRLLDPMCGRGTTVFVGMNRGWDCTGSDIDKNDLAEAGRFLKRYLEYHRFKYRFEKSSLTLRGAKPVACEKYIVSDTAEHFRDKDTREARFVNTDANTVRGVFGTKAFHMIVTDLPYGVQHAAGSGTPETLLRRVLPGWRECLVIGGTVAVSFNAQTLKRDTVRAYMEEAGLTPLTGGAYDSFSHWVEQAVTRDIVVARRDR